MLIEITDEQATKLFQLKEYFQDFQGVHYFTSSYREIQCRGFINDIINYTISYWQQYENERLEKKWRKKKFEIMKVMEKRNKGRLPDDHNNLTMAGLKSFLKEISKTKDNISRIFFSVNCDAGQLCEIAGVMKGFSSLMVGFLESALTNRARESRELEQRAKKERGKE